MFLAFGLGLDQAERAQLGDYENGNPAQRHGAMPPGQEL
jgi:hypothetical protein